MSLIKNNNTKIDEKTNESIIINNTDNIITDNELINKIKEMNNNDAGKQLFKYILDDNTKEFTKFIYHFNIVSNDNKTNINLDCIFK